MIVKPDSVQTVKDQITKRCRQDRVNYSEIGRKAGVHPSQASRICRGEFKSVSQNVVQICSALGIVIDGFAAAETSDPATAMLIRSVLNVWKGTREDAAKVAELLDGLASFRTHAD